MATVEEGWHTTSDGTKLYTKSFKLPSPKARLLFVHGFSDHCNNYTDNLFPRLADRGIEVISFDQRGWGRSVKQPSDRGLTGPTPTVLADITSMLRTLLPSPAPLFLMGHSMGGGEVLTYGAQGPSDTLRQIRGMLAEAPLIALHPSTRPWRGTVMAGRLAGRIAPHLKMVNRLDSQWLSRDPQRNRDWEADPLCHDTGTLEGLAGMLDRGEGLEGGSVMVPEGVNEGGKTRLWIGHGTGDRVNDYEGSRRFFDACPVADKELRTYDGWYHNLHIEPGEDQITFANDVAKWILDRADASADEGSRSKL